MPARLNIKNADAYRAASRLSELTGQTKAAVVIMALREALNRLEQPSAGAGPTRPDVAVAPRSRD